MEYFAIIADTHASVCLCSAGGAKDKPSSFGRLCAACDPDMIAYAQLEIMAMLPSLKVAKLQQPPKVDEADIKVGTCGDIRPFRHLQFDRQEYGQCSILSRVA
jgi:hypothetical protein